MIGVTSFSAEGYEKYGKNFLKHAHHFPGKILVYTEAPLGLDSDKIEERNLFTIQGISGFLSNIKNVPLAHGITERGHNYNFNVWKFCRKMFCQFEAFKEGGKVFWLDADLEFKKDIPEEFLDDLLGGEPLVVLDRIGFHSETGFVGFDTEHDDFNDIAIRYMDSLRKGIIFQLERWHDCEALD